MSENPNYEPNALSRFYQKIIGGMEGEGSVSVFNLFFGFRKLAANFVWVSRLSRETPRTWALASSNCVLWSRSPDISLVQPPVNAFG